jgi:hypothetical protein
MVLPSAAYRSIGASAARIWSTLALISAITGCSSAKFHAAVESKPARLRENETWMCSGVRVSPEYGFQPRSRAW